MNVKQRFCHVFFHGLPLIDTGLGIFCHELEINRPKFRDAFVVEFNNF